MTKKPDKTLNEKADTTNDQVASDDAVSRTEHSVGSRQPDDGTYNELRQQPPLQARDIPQKIVTAENDTPTPGEK
jgi:hypothetical protein